MGAISLLRANAVVNQGFIVAAGAQSLQRQNKAFIAFVRPPLPVKMFYLLLLPAPLVPPSLCVCPRCGIYFLEKCLRRLAAMEHLGWR